MEFVQKENYFAAGFFHFVNDGLQAFLKLAAELGAGEHCGQIQGQQAAVFQGFRHIAGGDALRQALDDGRLADPGLADDYRVILAAAGKGLHHLTDFGVAAHYRVEAALPGHAG